MKKGGQVPRAGKVGVPIEEHIILITSQDDEDARSSGRIARSALPVHPWERTISNPWIGRASSGGQPGGDESNWSSRGLIWKLYDLVAKWGVDHRVPILCADTSLGFGYILVGVRGTDWLVYACDLDMQVAGLLPWVCLTTHLWMNPRLRPSVEKEAIMG